MPSAPALLAGIEPCCHGETWEPIPDWPHEASTCGRCRSIDRTDASGMLRLGQMLPQYPDGKPGKGYLYVNLLDGKRFRRVHVAVAVLEAHRGLKPAKGYEACHRFGVNDDNHLDGLYWGTKAQNRADRERHRAERSCDRYPPEMSQEAGSPRWARSVTCHGPSVTGDISKDTGSFLFHPIFLSHFISLDPFVRSVRTSIHTLRNRKAD